jgi:hypothetical protein
VDGELEQSTGIPPMATIETRPEDILEYWFGPDESALDARSDIWWGNVDDRDALDALL